MLKPVAIILLNWNTPVYTINCITSLKRYCNEELFDVIVMDNGSTDGSLSQIKTKYPDLIYIDNKQNLGFAEGNNKGLAYSINQGYIYSLLLNTDTLVDEDIVSKLTLHLDINPQAAAVQPAIYWMHNRAKIWNGKGKFNELLGVTLSDTVPPPDNGLQCHSIVKWVTGCCMLIRNSALKEVGLFNKSFFLYYEDVEISFRLRGANYELHYLPYAKIYHEAGASAKKHTPKNEGILSPIIHYYLSRNHFWFLRRYGRTIFYPFHLLLNGSYYLAVWLYFKLRGRMQKAEFVMKGLKEGIFTPKGLIWAKENFH